MYIYTHTSYWFCFWRTLIHTHITLYWQKKKKKNPDLFNKPWLHFSGFICDDCTYRRQKKPSVYMKPSTFLSHLDIKAAPDTPYFCFLSHWTQWKLCEASPAVWVFSLSASHPLGKGRVFSCRSPAQRTANEHSIKIHSSSPHWEFPLQFQLDNDALCSLYYIKVWYISSACNKSASR